MMQETQNSGLIWRKATSSEAGGCVEVAQTEEVVFIRDSKHPEELVLQLSRANWSAFLQAVRDGTYDKPAS
jgi:Domain of unknown function (DUF397)